MLKRQRNMQGDELQKLDNSDQYPVKLKQLMEEVRFAKEKQMNWSIVSQQIKAHNCITLFIWTDVVIIETALCEVVRHAIDFFRA